MNDNERREANKRLAQLLGWRIEERRGHWIVVSPSGGVTVTHMRNEGLAWVEALDQAYIPDFYGSVDACLDAMPAEMHVTVTNEADGFYWCRLWQDGMKRADPEIDPGWCMDGDTRLEAVAGALLSYAEDGVP